MEYYDYIFTIEIKQNEIEFVCQYNDSKLRADRAKSLIYNYVKLVKAFLGKMSWSDEK